MDSALPLAPTGAELDIAAELEPVSALIEGAQYVEEPAALIPGNRVRLLHDGVEAFPRMLEAIGQATRSVRLEIYTIADDATGRRFADALLGAAKRGIEVTLLYDAVGSWSTPRRFFRRLADGGVRVRVHRPLGPLPFKRLFHLRDHRKLLVIDSSHAYVGGMNIADDWAPRADGTSWRDLMLEIEGPAAASLEGVFRATWRAQGRDRFIHRHRPLASGNVALAVVAARQKIHDAYVLAIRRAQRTVLIAAGYFVPDTALLAAIRDARERGVEVSIMLPGKSDHWMIQAAGRACYDLLLSWGVRIYEWWDAMLHAKTAVVDASWATVGSFNLDSLSRLHNHELNVVVANAAFAQRLHDRFHHDARRSVLIERGSWAKRPWYRKLSEAVAFRFRNWL